MIFFETGDIFIIFFVVCGEGDWYLLDGFDNEILGRGFGFGGIASDGFGNEISGGGFGFGGMDSNLVFALFFLFKIFFLFCCDFLCFYC